MNNFGVLYHLVLDIQFLFRFLFPITDLSSRRHETRNENKDILHSERT
jgi:hypothetical protein